MALDRTITLLPGNRLMKVARRDVIVAIMAAFSGEVISVQFNYDNIRVVFDKLEERTEALTHPFVNLCDQNIKIDGGGSPILTVVLFDYPFEGSMDPVIDAMNRFGEYKSFRFQKYPYDDMSVYTGSRLIRMILDDSVYELPRHIIIGGYYCRLWHRGQTVYCNMCNGEGHKAGNCPYKGKCLRCKAEGHMSRNCPQRDSAPVVESADGAEEPGVVDPSYGLADDDHVDRPAEPLGEAVSGEAVPPPAFQDPVLVPALISTINPAPDVVSPGVDLRDNQLDELSQDSTSILGAVGNSNEVVDSICTGNLNDVVDPGCEEGPDSLLDAVMHESNMRKRTLSSGSSDSGPSESSEVASYSDVVSREKPPVPSQRRKRLVPPVNLSLSRSRPASSGVVADCAGVESSSQQ